MADLDVCKQSNIRGSLLKMKFPLILNYNKEILVTTMDTYPSVESHGLEDLKKEIEAMQ